MSELLQAIERALQHCNVTKIADMNEPSQKYQYKMPACAASAAT